jgi:hypothetical protein
MPPHHSSFVVNLFCLPYDLGSLIQFCTHALHCTLLYEMTRDNNLSNAYMYPAYAINGAQPKSFDFDTRLVQTQVLQQQVNSFAEMERALGHTHKGC